MTAPVLSTPAFSLFPQWLPVAAAQPAMSAPWWQWVRLLRQTIGLPQRDEALALSIAPRRYAWLREVALCVDETPWVVARSVAPLHQLQGKGLGKLGERSLGSWLFQQPDLVRGPLEATATPPRFTHQQPGLSANSLWGRRSVFEHGGLSLLVQEYFLSTMADALGLPSR